jgi:hypothetical protein
MFDNSGPAVGCFGPTDFFPNGECLRMDYEGIVAEVSTNATTLQVYTSNGILCAINLVNGTVSAGSPTIFKPGMGFIAAPTSLCNGQRWPDEPPQGVPCCNATNCATCPLVGTCGSCDAGHSIDNGQCILAATTAPQATTLSSVALPVCGMADGVAGFQTGEGAGCFCRPACSVAPRCIYSNQSDFGTGFDAKTGSVVAGGLGNNTGPRLPLSTICSAQTGAAFTDAIFSNSACVDTYLGFCDPNALSTPCCFVQGCAECPNYVACTQCASGYPHCMDPTMAPTPSPTSAPTPVPMCQCGANSAATACLENDGSLSAYNYGVCLVPLLLPAELSFASRLRPMRKQIICLWRW